MSRRPWYRWYPADFQADTRHLSILERGAYRELLDHAYTTGRAISADEAVRIAGAHTPDEKAAIDRVLSEFWTLVDGRWTNPRVEREQSISTARAASGSKGGSKRQAKLKQSGKQNIKPLARARGSDPDPDPDLDLRAIGQPSADLAPADPFDAFWAAYPNKRGKLDARKAWRSTERDRPPLAQVLAALDGHSRSRQWQDRDYIPRAATWLRGHRWDDPADEPAAPLSAKGMRTAAAAAEFVRRGGTE